MRAAFQAAIKWRVYRWCGGAPLPPAIDGQAFGLGWAEKRFAVGEGWWVVPTCLRKAVGMPPGLFEGYQT
jgi:hypothetical protein